MFFDLIHPSILCSLISFLIRFAISMHCLNCTLLYFNASFFQRTKLPEWTGRYCALELIRSSDGRNLDLKKADIFSLGAAMYELCLSRELGEAQIEREEEEESEGTEGREGGGRESE